MTADPLPVSSPSSPSSEQLAAMILAEVHQASGLDLSSDPVALARIQEAAAAAARELTLEPEAEIDLPFLSANQKGPIHYNRLVRRGEFSPAAGAREADRPESRERPAQQTRLGLPERRPLVTTALLITMAAVYLLQELTRLLTMADLPAALGMKINQAIIAGEYWRLVTPMFLHGSILHLGFNLYALYILGRRAERFMGHWRFLGLFLLGGISGNLFSFLFTSAPSLGSSTAIFGLLAAEGVFIYQHQRLFGDRFKTALRQIVQVAVINFLIGLSPGIDNWGHFGGLLGGMAFSWFAGPAFEIQGVPPDLELVDRRPESKSALVFAIQLLLLAGLTAWAISIRS